MKKKAPRRPYHHGDLRRALLDEALGLIEEQGHAAFTLREVARRVGVSHAAPYRHFADKRALMTALGVESSLALGEKIRAALAGAGEDLRARFLAAARAYVNFARSAPAAFQVLYSGEIDPEDAGIVAAKEGTFGLLLGFIDEAQDAGFFPAGDRQELARAIWAMHHGVAMLAVAGAFEGAGEKGLGRIVDETHGRLLDGLAAERARGQRTGRD